MARQTGPGILYFALGSGYKQNHISPFLYPEPRVNGGYELIDFYPSLTAGLMPDLVSLALIMILFKIAIVLESHVVGANGMGPLGPAKYKPVPPCPAPPKPKSKGKETKIKPAIISQREEAGPEE